MIKHVVMIKLKDYPAAMERKMKLDNIKAELEALPNKISEIKFYEIGINVAVSPVAYDIVLISEFENMKDLNIYREHPEHKRVLDIIAEAKDSSVVVDYVID
jgi:hypothetical protein